jgi:chemotaxis protein MotB
MNSPIVIVKKRRAHATHHGGAWKVAYADFVTAMMALFIVLWLLTSSDQVKKAVGGYFQDPKGYGKQVGTTIAGTGETMSSAKVDMSEIRQKLEEAMKKAPEFQSLKDHVVLTVTGEGLRIELMETEKGMFFDSGSPHPSAFGDDLLIRLAHELGPLPNHILIEGHTDASQFGSDNNYSNWELSTDRANAARRVMQQNGLRPDQVSEIRGYGDQRLRDTGNPLDPSNRRISVIVKYLGT